MSLIAFFNTSTIQCPIVEFPGFEMRTIWQNYVNTYVHVHNLVNDYQFALGHIVRGKLI